MKVFRIVPGGTWGDLEHLLRTAFCSSYVYALECTAQDCEVQEELTDWLYPPNETSLSKAKTSAIIEEMRGKVEGDGSDAPFGDYCDLSEQETLSESAQNDAIDCPHCGFLHLYPRTFCARCKKELRVSQ